jgi:hypothetical protein
MCSMFAVRPALLAAVRHRCRSASVRVCMLTFAYECAALFPKLLPVVW